MSQIKDVMSQPTATLTTQDNVYEAAVLMKQYNVGFIPVLEQDRVVGLLTDRDIVVRGIAEKKPNSSRIRHVMTEQLITISPDQSIDEAADLMAEHQIRRLLVVDDGKLVGIVSLGDLAVRTPLMDEASHALSEISESPYTH